jgi:hypothetical protein
MLSLLPPRLLLVLILSACPITFAAAADDADAGSAAGAAAPAAGR